MRVRLPVLLIAVPLAASLAACGSSSKGPDDTGAQSSAPAGGGGSGSPAGPRGSITVFAAASLTETFTTLGHQFESAHPGTKVTFNFGASSTLANQINQGAPADVFASAAPKNMDQVVTPGNAETPVTFAVNKTEIAIPPSNPGHVTQLSDLAKSGVKVALCQEQVPCGVVAAQVFTNAHITVKPVTREADVKSTLAKVEVGEVDAGVVYVTDVKAAGTKVKGITIADNVNASTDYPIATLTHAKNAAVAQAFVTYVDSSAGKAVLTAAGFGSPS
ncbi:MAG TPA: molybdate ABC transporter substrate-binding protein [Jatrophihabitantaceae bacterium]|jgi:molybdate transport system substrate-binding protein